VARKKFFFLDLGKERNLAFFGENRVWLTYEKKLKLQEDYWLKTRILRVALVNALARVAKAVAIRTPLPALTGVQVVVDRHGVELTATNAVMTIAERIPANGFEENAEEAVVTVIESGKALLPGKIFVEIGRKLAGREIELIASDLCKVQLKSEQARFQLNGLEASKFPAIQKFTDVEVFRIPAEVVRSLIKKTHFAAAQYDNEEIMTGVLWEFADGNITCTATDTCRLSLQKVKAVHEEGGQKRSVIVPGKSLSELLKLLPEKGTDVEMAMLENQMMFRFGTTIFHTSLLQGTYPSVKKAIPDSWKVKAKLETSSLINAVDRAFLIGKDDADSNLIKLSVCPGKLMINSTAEQVGSFFDELEAETEGPELTLSLNTQYVLEALRAIDSTNVELYFNDHMSPCVVKVAEAPESVQLIVPVLTQ
jgi:DNA polymerase-3 subunit beta